MVLHAHALLLGLSWADLNRAASEAIKANDYGQLKAVLLELRPLMPGNPRVMYNLAASHAKLGDTAAAIAELKQLAASGLIYKKPNAPQVVSSIRRLRLP